MIGALIRLFKAVEIKARVSFPVGKRLPIGSLDLLRETLRHGFVFAPEVLSSYTESELLNLVETISEDVGLTPEQLNSSFHKSWGKIRDASIMQLFLEQIMHYITTYGFERLEIYDKDSVYIPKEELNIPGITIDADIAVIHGLTRTEIKGKALGFAQSGIALKEETMTDLMEIFQDTGISTEEVNTVKNKEVRIKLYDALGFVPEDPTEFLRYILYCVTGSTLLIKSSATIDAIRTGDKAKATPLFKQYELTIGLERLAEIFHRFKPIFLAFKEEPALKPTINRIRKLATKHHKPMKPDFLNNVTGTIKHGEIINPWELRAALDKANIFRKIRLAYALSYRTRPIDSILYKIRNGKGFATNFYFNNQLYAELTLDMVLQSIADEMSSKLKDKKVYIPENIVYALPATEKQFVGNVPSGSYVTVPKDMIFGIHWNNTQHKRIDLDLSLIDIYGTKTGWDARYRDEGRNILFSGDVTDGAGSNGATELFYVSSKMSNEYILFVNYFNYRIGDPEVPFEIIVASEQPTVFNSNYMVNPNNAQAIAKTKIDGNLGIQKMIGFLTSDETGCRFYFSESNIGRSVTSSNSEYSEHSRRYLSHSHHNMISLNMLLDFAGASLVGDRTKCDIDLSFETLERDTIINLMK